MMCIFLNICLDFRMFFELLIIFAVLPVIIVIVLVGLQIASVCTGSPNTIITKKCAYFMRKYFKYELIHEGKATDFCHMFFPEIAIIGYINNLFCDDIPAFSPTVDLYMYNLFTEFKEHMLCMYINGYLNHGHQKSGKFYFFTNFNKDNKAFCDLMFRAVSSGPCLNNIELLKVFCLNINNDVPPQFKTFTAHIYNCLQEYVPITA